MTVMTLKNMLGKMSQFRIGTYKSTCSTGKCHDWQCHMSAKNKEINQNWTLSEPQNRCILNMESSEP